MKQGISPRINYRLDKIKISEIPIAAIVSSVTIASSGKTIFSNNDISATMISANEKTFIYWQITRAAQCEWRDITRNCADLGVKDFIFIGKSQEMKKKNRQARIIKDHINLSGENPLIGPNEDTLGTRFPDMTELYNKDRSVRLKECCDSAGINSCECTLLVPKDLNYRTDLEKKILETRDNLVISKDVFTGAIIAKHQSLRSAGLFLGENISMQQKGALLSNIFRMF